MSEIAPLLHPHLVQPIHTARSQPPSCCHSSPLRPLEATMRRRTTELAAALLSVLALTFAPLSGQDVVVQAGVHGGAAVPMGDIGDDMGPGLALGLSVSARFTPLVGAYLSLNRASFSPDPVEGEEMDWDVTDSGVSLGVRGWLPVESPVAPWIDLGVLYHSFKTSAGGFGFELGPMLGFEAGVGADYAIAAMPLVIQPSARYRTYSGEMEFFGTSETFTVNYIEVRVGVAYPIRVGL